VIINAGKQAAGHLYVQTKDLTVSVVGTVFLVNAEEEGSRVAVIEGEVKVQQGKSAKSLLPGEQLSTNPQMEKLPVKEDISWSREAEVLAARLESAAPAQSTPELRTAFEVVSIRPGAALPLSRGRGAFAGEGERFQNAAVNQTIERNTLCSIPGSELDVNPGRIILTRTSVYRLVTLAYGLKDCPLAIQMGLLAGGPEWIRSLRFDIQATIPDGSPAYTRQQLNDGDAPKLQMMIQTMLSERFKLSLRRESKEVTIYNLVVGKPGKITLSEDQTPPSPVVQAQGFIANALPRGIMLNCAGNALRISDVAKCLQKSVGGTIVDKTDLKGLYDIPPTMNADPRRSDGPGLRGAASGAGGAEARIGQSHGRSPDHRTHRTTG
jgi:uncharacterized protein (TIGR03435 family)